MAELTLEMLRDAVREFVREREWEPFQTPKNLTMALSVEASELMEHFQWMTPEESCAVAPEKLQAIAHEVADVLIYLTRFADVMGIDPLHAAFDKLNINARKYPVERSRRSAAKYTEFED